ncbi:MAG: sodium/proton-translocating pyrophosphatase, partial [Acidobacteria bacterium]|nr:sodium/proton-translocating pyrophosphatase [Acidobacteriota bacterium]
MSVVRANSPAPAGSRARGSRLRSVVSVLLLALLALGVAAPALASETGGHRPGGEVNLRLPNLDDPAAQFLGYTGHQILLFGLIVCVLGLLFGAWTYAGVKKLPVHRSMAEVSALIYETCKAYLIQQGKFLMILLAFIAAVIVFYFWLTGLEIWKIAVILVFSLIGMA